MRRVLVSLLLPWAVLAAGLSPALAQRPSTTNLTCARVRTVVARQGAAVLGTGGPTFDRFVRDRSFCEATEIGRRAFVPTRDNPGCFVGYTCYEPGPGDRFGDF
ncbi:Putative DNA-binding transcriptional regulator AlpA [Methylorubrum thiocyanatum]